MIERQTFFSRRLLLGGGVTLLAGCGRRGAAVPASPAAATVAARPAGASPSATTGARNSSELVAVAPDAGVPVTRPEYFVHAGPRTLALSFDDGPSPVYTAQVLELLHRYGVPATFFMIGENIEKYPDVLRQVVAAGHCVGNHTWSHPDLGLLSRAGIRRQIERTSELIARIGGIRPPTLFRAPGGFFPRAAFAVCAELELRPISWSVDPEDWSNPGTDAIIDRVLRHTRTGSIVLEHDGCLGPIVPGGPADRSQTVAALAAYLPRLLDAGYRFASIGPVG